MHISAQNIRFIFGLKLKQLRADSNFSLSELSALTNISKSYLNEIEKGKKYPKPEKINKLASVLNTSYDDMVSLQLDKKLSPISSLVKSNLLDELPLDFFGVNAHDLLVLLSNAPTQFSAFVDAIIRIGREHDFKVESLYFSVLRSYQEMHDNYFPDLEKIAQSLRKNLQLQAHSSSNLEKLILLLETEYGYRIILDGFSKQSELKNLRYLLVPSKKPTLLLNKRLSYTQQLFILSREVGFKLLNVTNRPLTSSWIETLSFEHVLNNFKSYYLASALLLDERSFTKGLVDFTKKEIFNPTEVIALIKANKVSAEVFMIRITNLVPKYFRYTQLFFTRYNHSLNEHTFTKTKALHGSGLAQIASNHLELKACQRWVALDALNQLQAIQDKKSYQQPICTIHKVNFENSTNQYLVITVAHPIEPGNNLNCSLSVGFLINKRFVSQTKFANDSTITQHVVTNTWLNKKIKVHDGISTADVFSREQEVKKLRSEIQKILKQ